MVRLRRVAADAVVGQGVAAGEYTVKCAGQISVRGTLSPRNRCGTGYGKSCSSSLLT
jgi:hypothetical protein